jgi:hypothetical protein
VDFSNARGVMFLSDSHFIKFKVEIGPSSNNYVDFRMFIFLLKCTIVQGIKRLQIYDDFSLVINWMQWDTLCIMYILDLWVIFC